MSDKPTIEFEKITKEREYDIIRRSFRVPAAGYDIKVIINGKSYEAVDISPEGVSILCQKDVAFTVAQIIKDCALVLPGETIKNLTAKIIHFTSTGQNRWQNGIQWADTTDEFIRKTAEVVSGIKRELLADPDQEFSFNG